MKDKNNPMFGIHRYGKDNPNWQGGLSFEIYPIEFSRELKEKIRNRDNHECQICHMTEIELDEILAVHHIDYNKDNCNEENLISLCNSCHSKTNGNRKYCIRYFRQLIKIIAY